MIKTEQGQNLLDLAVQYCGDASAAFDIALLNGFSLTDDLKEDKFLDLPAPINIAIANFFRNHNLVPASAATQQLSEQQQLRGIGNWSVGKTFIIS